MASDKRTTQTIGRDVVAIQAELAERGLLGVAEVVAARHHITVEELLGVARRRPLPQVRRHLWLELTNLGWSSTRIGDLVGRNHTTILDGVREVTSTLRALGLCVRCAGTGQATRSSGAMCETCLGNGKDRERRSA